MSSRSTNRFIYSLLCASFFAGIAHAADPPSVKVYLSAPNMVGVQTFSNVTLTTETFDTTTSGSAVATGTYKTNYSSAIGTYQLSSDSTSSAASSWFQVVSNDDYGANTGQYMSVGAQSKTYGAVTLLFAKPQSYFGLSWDAGDTNNGFTFYNGTTRIGRYSTADTITLLKPSTIKTVDGSTYNTADYYGKPTGADRTTKTNGGEPYGYLNFFAADANSYFDRVVFDNNNSTGTGFETDNHTIISKGTISAPLGSFVSVGQAVQPEPASFALLLPPVAGIGGLYLRRRRTAKALITTEQD